MIQPSTPVAQIVLDHSACAPVLQRLQIDFCCRGHLALEQACEERGVDAKRVIRELESAIATRDEDDLDVFDARLLDNRALIEHIVNVHHLYLRDVLPFLVTLSQKVARAHGARVPGLLELQDVVLALRDELIPHIDYEEYTVFPALLSRAPGDPIIREALKTMYSEHPGVALLLGEVRRLTGDYTVPEEACTSYTTLFRELEKLESDTLRHVHLENHVLMPRFVSLVPGAAAQLR